ncbi:hypothetical protein CUR178_02934 [Leishmania enriettii]|uniref:Uncharacterized protein n=1 Tax=Leishmania enriettii TaxID=5663 RepID=A0A836KP60_LEIEN|nr:hypothetical protein CUR178_02934 [Leishmania enriettii]
MPRGRVGRACALLALLSRLLTVVVVVSPSDAGAVINAVTQSPPSNEERIASALADEGAKEAATFTNLMQLTAAVLAPVWSAGGFACVLKDKAAEVPAGTSRPVGAHTSGSGGGTTAPFTFSMFDTQFSPVYLVSPSTMKSAGGAASLTAQVAGRLDLR